MKGFVALVSGFIFALGLGLSGMTQPHIVRGFLDVFGSWDWKLVGVMVGAISTHTFTYRYIIKRSSPILDSRFHLPNKKDIDKRLIFGAILFGLGWGWVGICPGPGLVASVSGNWEFFFFLGSMLIGMKGFQVFERKYLT